MLAVLLVQDALASLRMAESSADVLGRRRLVSETYIAMASNLIGNESREGWVCRVVLHGSFSPRNLEPNDVYRMASFT